MADQVRLQHDIQHYVEEVTSNEWSSMEHDSFSEKALAMMAGLIKDTIELNPISERQKSTYEILVNAVTDASESRRGRINISNYGMQPIEWMSLLIGGAITIVFTFFFNVENLVAHMLMTTMVSLILAMNLYLVYLLNHPFTGGLSLPPDQFEVLKKAIVFTDPMMPGLKEHAVKPRKE